MKKLFFVISFFAALNANARAFYVSAAGSDANTFAQAQSSSTPWATVTKINAQLSSMSAGDSVLFRKGDVFAGVMLDVTISGIVFSNYGTGSNPVISGFTDLTWTSIGGNLWESQVLTSRPYVVLIGGNYTLPSRQPNTGYFDYESSAGSNSITDATLTGTWNGGDVVVRKNHTMWDHGTITQTGTTITFTNTNGDGFTDGYGYFIQNIIAACDLQNEWAFTTSTNKITLFSTTTPTNCKAAQLATVFNSNGFSFVVDGIDFTGTNTTALNALSASSGVVVKNCSFTNNGSRSAYIWNSPGSTVQNCTVTNSNESGIEIAVSPNSIVSGNNLYNIGIEGQGVNLEGVGIVVSDGSHNTLIEKNTIRKIGHNGINIYFGNNITANKNRVDSTNLVKEDGGGIYSYLGTGNGDGYYSGLKITNNIISNAIGAAQAKPYDGYLPAFGIYLDDNAANFDVENNVVFGCTSSALYIHNARHTHVRGNLFYNNGSNLAAYDVAAILIVQNSYLIAETVIAGNIFFSPVLYQYGIQIDFGSNTIPSSFWTLDKNYYCNPLDETHHVARTYISGDPTAVLHSFAAWKTYTGKDANSAQTFTTVSTADSIRFEFNATDAEIKVDLSGGKYLEATTGRPVNDFAYIPAWSGIVLIQVNRTSTNKLLMKQ